MNVIIISMARKWQSTFIFIICGSYEILLYSTMGWKSLWSCNWLFHFQKKFTFTKSTIQNVQRSQSYIIFHLFLGTLQCYVSKSSEDKSICPLIWIGCGEVFAVQCNCTTHPIIPVFVRIIWLRSNVAAGHFNCSIDGPLTDQNFKLRS